MNNLLSKNDTRAVLDILIEQLDVNEGQLTPEAKFKRDLNADSLTITEIILALEDHFGFSMPDSKLDDNSTVGDLFEVLAEELARRGTS